MQQLSHSERSEESYMLYGIATAASGLAMTIQDGEQPRNDKIGQKGPEMGPFVQ